MGALEHPLIVVAANASIYREILLDGLQTLGYRATGCGGEHAFEAIRHASPALVLIDMDVEREAQGWALLARLQADTATAATPVIVCSTHTYLSPCQGALIEQARADYLAKPFTLGTLLATVGAAVGSPPHREIEERT